jgi:hypothetical protein
MVCGQCPPYWRDQTYYFLAERASAPPRVVELAECGIGVRNSEFTRPPLSSDRSFDPLK